MSEVPGASDRVFETELLIPTFIGGLLYEKKLFGNL